METTSIKYCKPTGYKNISGSGCRGRMNMNRYISILIVAFVLFETDIFSAPRSEVMIPAVDSKGKICFALYTTQANVLKITAQFYPLSSDESRVAALEIKDGERWRKIADADITEDEYGNEAHDRTWTAHFRVDKWDMSRDVPYRITALDGKAVYEGRIRHDPSEKDEITVAVFTGNSIYKPHGGDIPRDDIVRNIETINPDLLFFSGDQVYDHTHHLGYWLKFGRDFGEIIRHRPTVTIPDDHDVGQANLWGANGRKSLTMSGDDGGYFMPVSYVKAVERTQTWHLPDPYDPAPIEQGIGVYYTSMTLGRISFAIIEDRKFKSGPKGLIPQQGPRPDHILNPDYNPESINVKGAVLLGDRQLKFLYEWGQDWKGADMKAVLSQTIFCGGAHIHGKIGGRLHADLDSNGWPQAGRNKALAEIRRCFAVHLAGDQHLATIFHHGIDDWEDACYSFCCPSIATLYLRWGNPVNPGENRMPGLPDYTGRYFDGFGNRVTCWAAANPSEEPSDGNALTTRAAGFGIARFNRKTREITFECWPRNVNVGNADARQYPGWPKTIKQTDNYGRKAKAFLPTLLIKGQDSPVVQIIDEANNEIIYTLRIHGSTFRPKVFREGSFTIKVGEGERARTLPNIKSTPETDNKTLEIAF